MLDTQLMEEGLALMAFGMGFVFVFLTVLVVSTTLMSMLVRRLAPAPVADAAARPSAPAAADDNSDELMVVMSAALHRYRQRHRR
ncbi:OadG family transporter subunit [Franzmannia qiaohouensis]|uniref:Probable oxaloacetate decarboxylase gamma chain n=1 Tax=Franzmannia qiaohouensis TaxID=1329370 RepID=A0ABU1HFZ8_9GAMM|nr:OadG family transporter subunit [Halomonas qiaohouensis]MDR5906393.1 OadG family transporter subunit [Halomonas qiaohouensis]